MNPVRFALTYFRWHRLFQRLPMMAPKFGVTLGLVGLLLACAGNSPMNSPAPDVYVAGYEWNGTESSVAKVWKNGVAMSLTAPTSGGRANALAIHGTDVYAAGFELSASGIPIAKSWKNGSPTTLSDGVMGGYAHAIQVVGTDVYTAGGVAAYAPNAGGYAAYWKNTTEVPLPSDTPAANTGRSILASGTDIFVAGTHIKTSQTSPNNFWMREVAAIWRNGFLTDLMDDTHGGWASAIAMSGNDIYVSGSEWSLAKPNNTAVYWKNGVRVNLTNGTKPAAAYAITLSGSDVFVAGSESDGSFTRAKYWKNGVEVALTDGTKPAQASAITVSGGDVYVAGSEGGHAKYWKNGVPIPLTNGTTASEATAIVVIQH